MNLQNSVSALFNFRLQKLEEKRQKAERQKHREEKRKRKQLMKLKEKETREMNMKIAVEERKLLIAQRKLESIRLLDELFERIKVCHHFKISCFIWVIHHKTWEV